jgi:hypothetical protein
MISFHTFTPFIRCFALAVYLLLHIAALRWQAFEWHHSDDHMSSPACVNCSGAAADLSVGSGVLIQHVRSIVDGSMPRDCPLLMLLGTLGTCC